MCDKDKSDIFHSSLVDLDNIYIDEETDNSILMLAALVLHVNFNLNIYL